MIKRLCASFQKALVPILRRRPLNRLASDIIAYQQDLHGRAKLDGRAATALEAGEKSLQSACASLEDGDIEKGWKCLQAARRLELIAAGSSELLDATAVVIRNEAEKLGTWRKNAVITLLTVKDGENPIAERVFQAALLRDEHYNNEAYKEGLRRSSALSLAIVLVMVLAALLWMSWSGCLGAAIVKSDFSSGGHLFNVLLSVAAVGLLGATISAIIDAPKPQSPVRIPEAISTIRVMILRLLMGPASAVMIYFAIQSNLYNVIFRLERPDGFGILIVAFAAGFTERLVLRVVETISGKKES